MYSVTIVSIIVFALNPLSSNAGIKIILNSSPPVLNTVPIPKSVTCLCIIATPFAIKWSALWVPCCALTVPKKFKSISICVISWPCCIILIEYCCAGLDPLITCTFSPSAVSISSIVEPIISMIDSFSVGVSLPRFIVFNFLNASTLPELTTSLPKKSYSEASIPSICVTSTTISGSAILNALPLCSFLAAYSSKEIVTNSSSLIWPICLNCACFPAANESL